MKSREIGYHLAMYTVVLFFFLQCVEIIHCATSSGNFKQPLRYGFHRTKECYNFEKAFLCIRNCLDLHYDVAYADKTCSCTCFTKKDKPKLIKIAQGQKWKAGAPTTKIPAWAQPEKSMIVQHGSAEKIPSIGAENSPFHKDNNANTTGIIGNQTVGGDAANGGGDDLPLTDGKESPIADNKESLADKNKETLHEENEKAPLEEDKKSSNEENKEKPSVENKETQPEVNKESTPVENKETQSDINKEIPPENNTEPLPAGDKE